MTYKRPESVLVVVYTNLGEALLLKRKMPFTFWQSVTGSIRWNDETSLQAAVRELWEETGIKASPRDVKDWRRRFKFPILKSASFRYQQGVETNVEHVFSIQIPQIVPVSIQDSEHEQFQWLDLEAAAGCVWSWSNREALMMVKTQMFGCSHQ